VMILLTGCLFLIPEKIPEETQEQPAAPRQLQPLLKPLLVAICLLPLGDLIMASATPFYFCTTQKHLTVKVDTHGLTPVALAKEVCIYLEGCMPSNSL